MPSRASLVCQVFLGTSIVALVGIRSLEADEPIRQRRYEHGPLTAADFRAPPPEVRESIYGRRVLAYTFTECNYTYGYQYSFTDNSATASLTKLDFHAVLIPEKSWNATPGDARLLDHEQGHFDITHAAALAAQRQWDRRLRREKIEVRAATVDAAKRRLKDRVEQLIQPIFDELSAAHKTYDRETEHGTDAQQQSSHRHSQQQRLKSLGEELSERQTGNDRSDMK
ncbi:MAG: hypothetical protein KDA47_02955 [Planctomycetales bacterium]|nr:hypothetical protein [Planctomycetales bacterium]